MTPAEIFSIRQAFEANRARRLSKGRAPDAWSMLGANRTDWIRVSTGFSIQIQRCARVAFLMPGVSTRVRGRRPEVAALERNTLGAKLKRRRLELGLRQRDVAPGLGISHKTLVDWERDQTAPAVAHYPAILDFLRAEPWPEPNTLGEKLRAERYRWSIARAATHLCVDEGTFGGWERGTRKPLSESWPICESFLSSVR